MVSFTQPCANISLLFKEHTSYYGVYNLSSLQPLYTHLFDPSLFPLQPSLPSPLPSFHLYFSFTSFIFYTSLPSDYSLSSAHLSFCYLPPFVIHHPHYPLRILCLSTLQSSSHTFSLPLPLHPKSEPLYCSSLLTPATSLPSIPTSTPPPATFPFATVRLDCSKWIFCWTCTRGEVCEGGCSGVRGVYSMEGIVCSWDREVGRSGWGWVLTVIAVDFLARGFVHIHLRNIWTTLNVPRVILKKKNVVYLFVTKSIR